MVRRGYFFIGQLRSQKLLTQGGKNTVEPQFRPHGEFGLLKRWKGLHGNTSTGSVKHSWLEAERECECESRSGGSLSSAADAKARKRCLCRSTTFEHCHAPDPPPQAHCALLGSSPVALCWQVMASVRRIAGEVDLRRAASCGMLIYKDLSVRRYALCRFC